MTEPNQGRIRAGDADRDRVVEQLRTHHEAGRLDAEEFTQRMESAMLARHLDELPQLLADLPPSVAPGQERAGRDNRRGAPRGPRPTRGWFPPLVSVFAVAFILAVTGSIAVLASGHFPWGLLWVGLGFLWLVECGGWRRRRWAAHWDPYGHQGRLSRNAGGDKS